MDTWPLGAASVAYKYSIGRKMISTFTSLTAAKHLSRLKFFNLLNKYFVLNLKY